jgi:hypothetical protein
MIHRLPDHGIYSKRTMKIMGTNEPCFNQEFFFDLIMPFGSMLDKGEKQDQGNDLRD